MQYNSKWEEVLEDLEKWEDYIDEPTYNLLYSNLCIKFSALIKYLLNGNANYLLSKRCI